MLRPDAEETSVTRSNPVKPGVYKRASSFEMAIDLGYGKLGIETGGSKKTHAKDIIGFQCGAVDVHDIEHGVAVVRESG